MARIWMSDSKPVKSKKFFILGWEPVYIPLPGAMQNVINRLCPLIEPRLEFRQGRTRARFRDDVNIRKIVLVSTGGWWEKENFDTVVRIVEELAEAASVEFGGSIEKEFGDSLTMLLKK